MHLVQVNVPEIATKQLRFRQSAGRRVLTISTNLLTLFDFAKGDAVTEKSLGPGRGLVIERVYDLFAQPKHKKVYARSYKRRRNNPIEHLVEVSSQQLIEDSFPAGCTRVHIEFERGRITVTPLATVEERAKANAAAADPSSTFAALTSGVDLLSLRQEGFNISAVLEWRPPEARDKNDLTETGALAALSNSGPLRALFNEDITACVLDRIAAAMVKAPVMLLHASPQCDDHSPLKAKSLKDRDEEQGSSSADMILDILGLVEKLAPPLVLLENVPGMIGSAAYEVASLRLRRWGYRRHEHVGDARDYGGLTSRKRAYVLFTQLEAEFAFEEPTHEREKNAWAAVKPFLEECRNVSTSKSIRDGKACGRLRTVTPTSKSIPTPVKSQYRMAKDSLVIEPEEGKYLFPNEALLKHVLGIDDVDLSAVSETIASEIIGQSIDMPHHQMVLRSVRRHIADWRSRAQHGARTSCANDTAGAALAA